MQATYSVSNLSKYQHYKERNPPWVKVYRELLTDHGFASLSDGAKWFAIASILLASRYDNAIPADPTWLWGQTGSKSAGAVVGYLSELSAFGFIELQDASILLATCKQSAIPETETETEEEKKNTAPPHPAPPERPSPRAARSAGVHARSSSMASLNGTTVSAEGISTDEQWEAERARKLAMARSVGA